MYQKNEWVEWLKSTKNKICVVHLEDKTEITGKIVLVNWEHLNFILDTQTEYILIRNNWRFIRIQK